VILTTFLKNIKFKSVRLYNTYLPLLQVKCANVACERTNRPFMSYEDLAEVAFKTSDSPRVRKLARPAK